MPAAVYRLSPLAEADLEDIWRYTERTWSVQQAERYHAGIIAALEALAAGETFGRPANIRPGYLTCSVGSHTVYFRSVRDGIAVVRILHRRMDVSRHLPG
ncbi:type II toxin-antitoxin system RelE/ParE family toxin [Enterovirga rhinocerotis]|uniref:Toxin n=1 Tax=Enterovirga rhinocerotis TaxID=1339210 RepID=A0A4R7BW89_9HYPH|nr:type II toxin-antitoxin system RelE/ParE family toxin [Enterovirga rhinocerotis]TDR88216.1 toxin ParE1/3/4 [Enterovirga rhinocerotis]